jgi:hypothetical protein
MPDTGRFRRKIPYCFWLAFAAGTLSLAQGVDSGETRPASDTFMVIDRGTALLGPDGEEIERLESIAHAAGALSQRWPTEGCSPTKCLTDWEVIPARRTISDQPC